MSSYKEPEVLEPSDGRRRPAGGEGESLHVGHGE